ncbi:MAG: response regulator [Deltaproteobacteria bacterium]|nr:response regulator [Deltaproteobacteria bacterium]
MKVLEEKGELRNHEMKFIRKDGQFIDINLSASLLKNEEGDVIGTLGIYSDITERNMLEAQLAQAQRMEALGTLAGGIAHNFNNLLMGIQGNASLMLLETDPNHPNYQKLKTIEKSVQSGSRLTRQLLGYAREGKYEVKPISLNQLVKETADTFSMTKKEIRIHQELAQDLSGIKADQGQIEQALLNIYVNASDAMSGGGDLFLKTINVKHKDIKNKPFKPKPGNYVLLTIRDTGVGMDKHTMKRIFEPFFTTKGLAKGTGLGLASTYGIIKAHGGYIDVDSENGHGTTFSIYLPASERKVGEVAKDAGQIIKGRGVILLVDDEEIVLDVGVQLLEALGYTVFKAKGGREAVEIYKENKDKINIVLLDIIMPDMSGGQVYERMKEINPDIKVLLSSGYNIEGQATEILERGCDGFIQKPFNMKELSRSIDEILNKG